MTFKENYNQLKETLKKDLKIDNHLAIPHVEKIVINVGAGEAATNKKVLDKIVEDIALITGQKPVITKAKKSIAAFKIRKDLPIGVKTTLRGEKMYFFLEKFIKIVLPRIRDFKGISAKSFDGNGNLNVGITEQTLFPEIEYDKIDRLRGLEITIVTSTRDNDEAKKLFTLLGIPFRD
jgi:large subunit ribosomal protein L5